MCCPSSISSLSHRTCANEDIDVERKRLRASERRKHAHAPDSEVISALTCEPDGSEGAAWTQIMCLFQCNEASQRSRIIWDV